MLGRLNIAEPLVNELSYLLLQTETAIKTFKRV
jgi:hypothetical protein